MKTRSKTKTKTKIRSKIKIVRCQPHKNMVKAAKGTELAARLL